MSKARPYDKDSLERALVHHGVTYMRPGEDRPKWYIDAGGGQDMTDREVYAFLAGFKLAKDRGEKVGAGLAALVREFQIHDQRKYGQWTRGMHRRANEAVAPFGYPEADPPSVFAPPRTPHSHVVAESFCNECEH